WRRVYSIAHLLIDHYRVNIDFRGKARDIVIESFVAGLKRHENNISVTLWLQNSQLPITGREVVKEIVLLVPLYDEAVAKVFAARFVPGIVGNITVTGGVDDQRVAFFGEQESAVQFLWD